MDPIAIIHAPTPLGLRAPAPGVVPGTRKMPEALRLAGLHAALGAEYAGTVTPGEYRPDKDPDLGLLNPHAIRDHVEQLAAKVEDTLGSGRFPLVLGGDCSVLLGCVLALRRHGRYGLLFLDGHADNLTPETTQSGGVAGMDLAIVTGTGVELLTDIGGLRPYVLEADAVQLGCRDPEYARLDAELRLEGTGIRVVELSEVRALGPAGAAAFVLRHLGERVEGVWLHLDADVLDDAIMPAVDSRQPGGLSYPELVEILRFLLGSGRVIGMDVTIYDPDMDPAGEIGRAFASALVGGIADGTASGALPAAEAGGR